PPSMVRGIEMRSSCGTHPSNCAPQEPIIFLLFSGPICLLFRQRFCGMPPQPATNRGYSRHYVINLRRETMGDVQDGTDPESLRAETVTFVSRMVTHVAGIGCTNYDRAGSTLCEIHSASVDVRHSAVGYERQVAPQHDFASPFRARMKALARDLVLNLRRDLH